MINTTIQELRARYRTSAEDKRAVLDGLLTRYRSVGKSGAQLNGQLNGELNGELKEFLHKLAGSSGMYGYDQLHAAARRALVLFEGSEKTEELTASVESIARSLELVIKELDAL